MKKSKKNLDTFHLILLLLRYPLFTSNIVNHFNWFSVVYAIQYGIAEQGICTGQLLKPRWACCVQRHKTPVMVKTHQGLVDKVPR